MRVHMEHTQMHADACSHRLPFSYTRQRELCVNKDHGASFPAQTLGSEQQLLKYFCSGERLSTP